MSKTYFPSVAEYIEASSPHPSGTKYKVSKGYEDWNGSFVEVYKVQLEYNGKIAGRKTPSFPIDSNDHQRVLRTIEKLATSEK